MNTFMKFFLFIQFMKNEVKILYENIYKRPIDLSNKSQEDILFLYIFLREIISNS
jgi:hypothetical protein